LHTPEGELPGDVELTPPDEGDEQAQPGEDAAQPDPFVAGPAEDMAQLEEVAAQPDEDVAQPAVVTQEPAAEITPQPRHLSRAERDQFDRQQRRFAACGRCGYFVADCRIYLGLEAYQAAVLAARDGWLRLEGDATFRRLLQNAYGVQHDVGYDYLDGSCPECRRRFVYAEREDGLTRFKISV
jgi:hypothetical protein